MNTMKLSLRLFHKNKLLSIPFYVFLSAIFIYQLYHSIGLFESASETLSHLSASLEMSMYLFIGFLFFSYEYFYVQKASHVEETLKCSRKGFQSMYGTQFAVMAILSAAFTLVCTIYQVVVYFVLQVNHLAYLWHILFNMFLNYFVLSLLAMVLGLFCSLLFNRLTAYLLLVLFIIFSTPICEIIVSQIHSSTGLMAYRFYDFFNVFLVRLAWDPNSLFGYSLLSYRIELIGFWIFLAGTFVFFRLSQGRKKLLKIGTAVCALLCVVNIALFIQPASKIIMNYDPEKGISTDVYYYNDDNNKQLEQNADFHITTYDLDFTFGRQLSAKATLTVDNPALKAYRFTLYHGYKVQKAEAQDGTALKFTQESDYVTVFPEKPTVKLVLTYKGFSSKFFSNAQGVFLPGFFPFYPQSGFYKIFDDEKSTFLHATPTHTSQFHVNVTMGKKVFSNLTESKNGMFTGESNGLTLMSGFLDTATVDGVELIYPYLQPHEYSKKEIESNIKKLKAQGIIGAHIKKVFTMPNMNMSAPYERCAEYTDHMDIRQLWGLSSSYKKQKVAPEKLYMLTLLEYYNENKNWYGQLLEDAKSRPGEDSRELRFARKLQKLGGAEMVKRCNAYVDDKNDKRTTVEFLDSL